jgi:hypothetical protein
VKRSTRFVGAAVGAAATAVALSAGLAAGNDDQPDPLDDLRRATARYRDVDNAIEAGYVQFFGCIHEPLAGSMGIHFVNGALVGDAEIIADQPEALMYEQRGNGRLALTGAEYVVFQTAWDADHNAPPELYGETFNLVEEPNRYGIPAFYELHAWAWKHNPTGAHEDWNPQVLCAVPDRNDPPPADTTAGTSGDAKDHPHHDLDRLPLSGR